MSKGRRACAATAVLIVIAAPPVSAQQVGEPLPLVEPAAIEALAKMGNHLQSMRTFTLRADTVAEVVLDTDQKLQIGGTAIYQVRRPDGLRIDLATDVVHGELVYDGKSMVYASPDQRVYAQVAAPPTISEALEQAAQRYNLAFPLADLFLWGTEDAPTDLLREGFFVGSAYVGESKTDHWAFRGPDQDVEIWIVSEGEPLPLKISLVDRSDLTHPRLTSVLDWTEDAPLSSSTFQYVAPEGFERIRFHGEGGGQ